MSYLLILLFLFLIILTSNLIGGLVNVKLNLQLDNFKSVLGYGIWIATLYIFSILVINDNTSSRQLFISFSLITLIFIYLGRKFLIFKRAYIEYLVIFIYVAFMILFMLRSTMGEVLGDNVFLINLVTKNVNTAILNNFNIATGEVYYYPIISAQKDSLTYYHFFSYILFLINSITDNLSSKVIPNYLFFVWISSVFFYYLSISFIIGIVKYLNIKDIFTKIIILLFSGLFIGTYYFNLTLAYYGMTYLVLIISLIVLMVLQYTKTSNQNLIIIIFLLMFTLYAHAALGLVVSAYILFGFVSVLYLNRNANTFGIASFLMIPLIYASISFSDYIPIQIFPYILSMISITLFIIHKTKVLKSKLLEHPKKVLAFLWFIFLVINIVSTKNYFDVISQFFEGKENFDRVRDYFSFSSLSQVMINLSHYIFLVSLIVNIKTRNLGVFVFVILLFFINPLTYPLFYRYFSFHYHRAIYTVFNVFTLSIGIFAGIDLVERFMSRPFLKLILVVLTSWFITTNVFRYESIYLVPSSDFNGFYRFDNQQIEILEVLREKIDIENYANAKVISQIYGTLIYVPEINHIHFTTFDRRYWDPSPQYTYTELFSIFYTPAFSGDDGPRFTANNRSTCELLIKDQIDFVIYDKSLSVFDEESGNWIPNHWYARGCAENAYENERYIMYRFYWK